MCDNETRLFGDRIYESASDIDSTHIFGGKHFLYAIIFFSFFFGKGLFLGMVVVVGNSFKIKLFEWLVTDNENANHE